jgi:hypothetical protein
LVVHKFGHHVVDAVIKHGDELTRHEFLAELAPSLPDLAKHKYASYCVQSLLLHCRGDELYEALCLRLLDAADDLAQCIDGCYVLHELNGALTDPSQRQRLAVALQPHAASRNVRRAFKSGV